MENKIIHTVFYMGEFLEEEKWLELQHREGWKLYKTDGKYYEFQKCEPEDFIYQLDFKKNRMAEESYLQMFADYGWEFVLQQDKWFVFRKKRLEGDADASIFSDNASRIELCRRVIQGRLLKLLPLLVLVILWDLMLICTDALTVDGRLGSILAGLGTAAVLIIAARGFSQFYNQRKRINRMIAGLKNPLG